MTSYLLAAADVLPAGAEEEEDAPGDDADEKQLQGREWKLQIVHVHYKRGVSSLQIVHGRLQIVHGV